MSIRYFLAAGFLLFLLQIHTPLAAQRTPDDFITALLNDSSLRSFNGVLLLAQDGKVQYKAARGLADFNTKAPIRLNDRFVVGSISKQVTAVLVLREVQRGRIKLQDRVRSYVPDMNLSWADSVTIHQLLSHTSGVAGFKEPLAFVPGTRFAYSNAGYALLGKILEKTSGRSFAAQAADLFRICNMKQSSAAGKKEPGLVPGYSEKPDHSLKEEKELMDFVNPPGGGVIATAEDLLRWNECLHGGKLLPDSLYRLMTTPYMSREYRWGKIGYGYGLQIDSRDGIREFSHCGYLPGYVATLIYYPGTRTSIVVLENIATDPKDMNRAFCFPDRLREWVRGRQ